jgi:hypothetical protein
MEQRNNSRIRPLIHKKDETEKRFQDQVEVRQKNSRIRGQKNGAEKRFQEQAVAAEKKTPGSRDNRVEQRKDSGIRRSMQKKEQNKTNKTEKKFQHQPEVRPVGHQSLEERNQEVDAKKEARQKDFRIRGTKEWSIEKIPRSGSCCGKKDFRIWGTKEWSREKIPGSAG